MWPRLVLLRKLLSESGSLWMTLDDNESHHARSLLDEIFGDENHMAQLAWEKVYSPRMDATGFSKDYDVVLCYAKNKTEVFIATQLADQLVGFDRSVQAALRWFFSPKKTQPFQRVPVMARAMADNDW